MIKATNLTVHLGTTAVIRGLDLTVRAGRLTAVAGPNGSGKSTLLRTLSGELGYSGTLAFHDRQMHAWRPEALAGLRGVLPQSSEVAFPFTVADIVAMGLELGAEGRQANSAARVNTALARVGLAGFGPRNYLTLSGGEQQRTQFARVLCQIPTALDGSGAPRLLLLDEPVASLDIRHQLEIMSVARDFARSGGAVVAIMHDLNLTALFADELLLLRDGQKVASGPVETVLTDANLEIAYGCRLRVNAVPADGMPFVLAQCAG